MIIWISSYPKSGSTWLRSLITSYFYSDNGIFNFNMLDKIQQFSSKNFSNEVKTDSNYQNIISRDWIPSQELINKDKKIHLLKTHNAMYAINNNKFTNKNNTAAVIYLVRDPRNLITSISHHYDMKLQDSFIFLTNKRKIIFPHINDKKKDFNFLGDWSMHYQSWKNIKFCPIIIIKYEDLIYDTKNIFIKTLKFLSNHMKIDFDEDKINKSIQSTDFNNLRNMEKKHGFKESSLSAATNKKIPFFNLGKNNNWKNILNKKMAQDIENKFNDDMKELGYL